MAKKSVAKASNNFTDGLGTSGFTLAVLSFVFGGLYGIILATVGFIFCKIQQKNKPTKIAKVGIIISIIGFILNIILWIVLVYYLNPLMQQFGVPSA